MSDTKRTGRGDADQGINGVGWGGAEQCSAGARSWRAAERDDAVASLVSKKARLVATLVFVVALATLFVLSTCQAQSPPLAESFADQAMATVETVAYGPDSGATWVVRFDPPITATDSAGGRIWWMTSTSGKACVTNAGADIFHRKGASLLCVWRRKVFANRGGDR